jgi:hypothetical protein
MRIVVRCAFKLPMAIRCCYRAALLRGVETCATKHGKAETSVNGALFAASQMSSFGISNRKAPCVRLVMKSE